MRPARIVVGSPSTTSKRAVMLPEGMEEEEQS